MPTNMSLLLFASKAVHIVPTLLLNPYGFEVPFITRLNLF